MNTKRLVIIFVLSLVCKQTFASQISEIILASLPIGYEVEPTDDAKLIRLVKFGNVSQALKEAGIEGKYDQSFLDDWFVNDQLAYLDIRVLDVPKEFDSAKKFQFEIGKSLVSHWGDHSNFHFEDGIGYFVSYFGALVYVTTKTIDGKVVLVESLNFAETLAAEDLPVPTAKNPQILIEHFSKSGSSHDVKNLFKMIELNLVK